MTMMMMVLVISEGLEVYHLLPVAGDLVLPRVDCCACTLYSVLYVWVYVVNGSLYER